MLCAAHGGQPNLTHNSDTRSFRSFARNVSSSPLPDKGRKLEHPGTYVVRIWIPEWNTKRLDVTLRKSEQGDLDELVNTR